MPLGVAEAEGCWRPKCVGGQPGDGRVGTLRAFADSPVSLLAAVDMVTQTTGLQISDSV